MLDGSDHDDRRRSPRAAVTCAAKIVQTGGVHFTARAENVGTAGCRVVAPRHVARGAAVRVILTDDHGEVDLLGTVAWVSDEEPWRIGIRFAPPSIAAARAWFEKLEASARAGEPRAEAAADLT